MEPDGFRRFHDESDQALFVKREGRGSRGLARGA
jgi:hypothetical protein